MGLFYNKVEYEYMYTTKRRKDKAHLLLLLQQICKLYMEHVIVSHTMSHLDRHLSRLLDLDSKQHGFRSGLSCETQLVSVIHEWNSSLKEKRQVDMALLDFSKAFDKVAHRRLIHKLEYYGITGHTCKWISAFLNHRT